MTQFTDQKKKEWQGDVAKTRTKDRADYAAGPALHQWFMDIYAEAVKEVKEKFRKPHVLILGATPETRDLVLDNQISLTILDQSQDMINNMTSLMKNKNSDLEKIVFGNWLKMPFQDNRFNLVLGDGASNNIEYKKQKNFFKEVKRILTKNGIMLIREGVLKQDIPIFTVQEILESYRKDKDFPKLFLELNLYSEIRYYNKEKYNFDMEKMFEKLESYKDLFAEKEYNKIMSWQGNLKHIFIDANKLKNIIEKIFTKAEIINREDNLFFKTWLFFKAYKS